MAESKTRPKPLRNPFRKRMHSKAWEVPGFHGFLKQLSLEGNLLSPSVVNRTNLFLWLVSLLNPKRLTFFW